MKTKAHSLRSFIGAKDFATSRAFYTALGFSEIVIDPKMSLFRVDEELSFYLQDYYVKDWIENSMLLLEVQDLEEYWVELAEKNLTTQFPGVRFSGIKENAWGREIFMHDPAGVLWHFCEFSNR